VISDSLKFFMVFLPWLMAVYPADKEILQINIYVVYTFMYIYWEAKTGKYYLIVPI
jgi:hypothetical protein